MDPKSLWLHSILIDALTRRDQTHRGLNALTRLRTTDGSHIALDTKAPAAISTPLMDAIATGRHTSIPDCWKAKCRHLQSLIDEADAAPRVDESQQQLPTLEEEDQEELDMLRQVVLQGIDSGVKQEDIKHPPAEHSEAIKVEMDTHHHYGNEAITVKQEDEEQEDNINNSSMVVCGPQRPQVEASGTDNNHQAVEEPQAPAAPRNPKSKLGKLIFQAKKKLGATEETTMQQSLQHQPLAAVTRRAPLSAAKSSELLSSSANGIRRGITMGDNEGSDDDGYESSANNTTTSTTAQPPQKKQLSYEEFLQTTHKRAPRQGEIGITVDEIESAEALGYVMSGSRNRNVQKLLDSKQKELHEKQADKDRLGFLAEDDRRKDEEAVAGLLDLF